MHRLFVASLPQVARIERAPARKRAPRDVVVDVKRGVVRRGSAEVHVAFHPDAPAPTAIAVDGDKALVGACSSAHGDASLVEIDFATRTQRVVHRAPGLGWVCGGFVNSDVVVGEQRLGHDAQFRVLFRNKVVWSSPSLQTPSTPALVRDSVVAWLLCLQPDAMTRTGPASVCALDLASGALCELAAAPDADSVRVEIVDGAPVVVAEGLRETVRVLLR